MDKKYIIICISIIVTILITIIWVRLWMRERALKRAIVADDGLALKKALAMLTTTYMAYCLSDLLKFAEERGSEAIRLTLLKYAQMRIPLEVSYLEIGYQSSKPKLDVGLVFSLLWSIFCVFVLYVMLDKVLKNVISSNEVRLLIQILAIIPFAMWACIQFIRQLSKSRYRLSREGIEIMPFFAKSIFVPWGSISEVRKSGRIYFLSWDSQLMQIRDTFFARSYLVHVILSHVKKTTTLNRHLMTIRELWVTDLDDTVKPQAPCGSERDRRS